MTEQKRRTRHTQGQPAADGSFKRPISVECKNCLLVEWDFHPYTYKSNEGNEVASDKVVAMFATDGGHGDFIAVEIYDKVMEAWDNEKPLEGERFDVSINIKSRKIASKDNPESSFFSNRVKCWKFKKCK